MMSSAEIIFWISVVFVFYTYAGYPVLIKLFARKSQPVTGQLDDERDWPNVTVIIPVHNEETNVIRKINNLQSVNYPPSKLEIIFVSDGSTDSTDIEIAKHTDIKLISYSPRQGKPTALNNAVMQASSNLLLFTDVRQEIEPTAIKYLVSTLEQNNIGAVSGELVHRDPETHTGKNVGLYWRYEKWIRKSESQVHSTAGVTGALYMIHRDDYKVINSDTLLDDFEIPINILKCGKRVVFDQRAIIYDDVQDDAAAEQKRKIRTLTGNYQSFLRNKWLFSPYKNPIFMQFLSHKFFRLLVPYALVTALVSSFLGGAVFYHAIALSQVLVYFIAYFAWRYPKLRANRVINLIVVFVSMNLAVMIALKNILMQNVEVRWEKI